MHVAALSVVPRLAEPRSSAALCAALGAALGAAALTREGHRRTGVLAQGRPIPLPTENSLDGVPGQGWQIETKVGQSRIPDSGNGRFASEAIRPGRVGWFGWLGWGQKRLVFRKVLVPMAAIPTLLKLPKNATVTFACEAELEKYIALMQSEGGFSRKEVLHLFEHFVYGFDGEVCCLNVSTYTVNHSDSPKTGLNTKVVFRDVNDTLTLGQDGDPKQKQFKATKALVGEVVKDIAIGDELFIDYRRFRLPQFYLDFTKKHCYPDVRTAVMVAVYGCDQPTQP